MTFEDEVNAAWDAADAADEARYEALVAEHGKAEADALLSRAAEALRARRERLARGEFTADDE